MSLPHRCIHVLWGLRRAPASSSRDLADPRSSRSPREAPLRRQRMPVQYSRRRGAATPPTGTARHDVLVAAAQLRVRHAPRLLWPAPAASRAHPAASTELSTPSIDPRGAAAAGGYTSARSAHRVDAGRAPPAFEPEPGGSVCPVPPPLPSHLTVTRRRRSPPPPLLPLHARLAHGTSAEPSPEPRAPSADRLDFPARESRSHIGSRCRARPSPPCY